MKRTESGRLLDKALLIIISLLLIFIGGVLFLKSLPSLGGPYTAGPATFTTVFTLADNAALTAKDYQEHLLLFVVLPLGVGIIGLVYAGVLFIFHLRPRPAPSTAAALSIIAICVGLGGLQLLSRTDAQLVDDCARLQHSFDSQQYRIAEGIVHKILVHSTCDRGTGDAIGVGDASLEVCYYESTCAYKQSIAHGGVLTEGTYARVFYTDDGAILRIDVKNQ